MTDWDLLREYVRTRSQPAFARLVERHVHWVHATCTRHTGDAHLAEDVTQAVFLLLSQKAARLKSETSIAGWLFRTARHASANAMKIQRRRVRRETQAAIAAADTLRDDAAGAKHESELLAALDRAMARLRSHDRDVLVLRFYNDKSVAEAAAEMGVSPEAAKKRFARSLDALRRALADQGAAVPAILVAATSKSSYALPAGLANWVAAGASPTNVTARAASIVRRMSMRKVLAAAAGSLLVMVGIGASVIASTRPTPRNTEAAAPPSPRATTTTAPTVRRLEGHTTWVTTAAISPDGRFGVSRSANQLLRWDLQTAVAVGKPVTIREQPFGLAVSNAGTIVAVDRPDLLVFDRFDTEAPRRLPPSDRRVLHWSLAMSPDGLRIAAGGADGVVRLLDVAGGDEIRTFRGHAGVVGVVAFAPDGRTLLSGGWDRTARLWDVGTAKELHRFGAHTSAVEIVAFSADGKLAATSARSMTGPKGKTVADRFVRVWDLSTGRQLHELPVPTDNVHAAAFSTDGARVVALVGRELLVWNVGDGKLADQREGVPDTCVPTGAAFSTDLQHLLVGGDGPKRNGLLFLVP